MPLPRLTIHSKIVVPFTCLFILVAAVIALVAQSAITTSLEQRILHQIEHASAMLAQTDFALNPVILNNVRLIVDVHIVTYRRDGTVLASTLSGPQDSELLRLIQAPAIPDQVLTQPQGVLIRRLHYRDMPYTVAYRPLRIMPEAIVACVVTTADVMHVRQQVLTVIGLVAVGMVLVMFLLSQMIARSITAPVSRLVTFTRTLAAGELAQQVEVHSRDEIGLLARGFNEMVQRLRQSEAKLVQSEKLAVAGQLAAGVAHDIRNPLSSLKLFVQMLGLERKGEADVLRIMLREIERVEWTVKGLLDFVRPGELQRHPCQLNTLVAETLRFMAPQLTHRKIVWSQDLDESLPLVSCDADRLQQALLNLILNAADAMPEGGELGIRTRLAADGAAVLIEILDTGIGIPADLLEHIFEPFISTKREGVGLGLMNAKNIIERHGGTLRLSAREVQGTCARLALPLQEGNREHTSPATAIGGQVERG